LAAAPATVGPQAPPGRRASAAWNTGAFDGAGDPVAAGGFWGGSPGSVAMWGPAAAVVGGARWWRRGPGRAGGVDAALGGRGAPRQTRTPTKSAGGSPSGGRATHVAHTPSAAAGTAW